MNWRFNGSLLCKFNKDRFEWFAIKRLEFIDKRMCQEMIDKKESLGERLSKITASRNLIATAYHTVIGIEKLQ